MEIINKDGDVLTSKTQVIAHQVNCKGVMGAGIAGQIRSKYPKVYQWYLQVLKGRDEQILGSCQMVPISDNQYICNLFAQVGYGRDGRYTNYAALGQALRMLRSAMYKYNLSTLSIPYGMSCGLGGGNWDTVMSIIKDTFVNTDFTIEIWKLN